MRFKQLAPQQYVSLWDFEGSFVQLHTCTSRTYSVSSGCSMTPHAAITEAEREPLLPTALLCTAHPSWSDPP